ncbi:putative pre-mRNA-processing factor 39 [Paratrimastix pyriformis]|uniref:Pre-mRNA-processing factor 39 n=1 Tax=Paratrimastix pyriformis TaxID=342808 RepID=A0ABQ8UTA6_9EUKA|nr:putative pre-mRNA-processing factor 39 [Paratrimastix pyriformis]
METDDAAAPPKAPSPAPAPAAPTADAARPEEQQPAAPAASAAPLSPEEVEKAARELLMKARESLYQKTAREVADRNAFEIKLKRHYFHVKPLDAAQLQTWHQYLEWEHRQCCAHGCCCEAIEPHRPEEKCCCKGDAEGCPCAKKQQQPPTAAGPRGPRQLHPHRHTEGHLNDLRTLYGRCLVACANYFRFWMRYIDFLRVDADSEEETRAAFKDATAHALKTRPNMYLARAAFEESTGHPEEARRVFVTLHTTVAPDLVEVLVRYANFERRQGRHAEALRILEEALAGAKDKTRLFLSMFTAKFYALVRPAPPHAPPVLRVLLPLHPATSHQGGPPAATPPYMPRHHICHATIYATPPYMPRHHMPPPGSYIQRAEGLGLPEGQTAMGRGRAILDAALEAHPDNFDLWVFAINLETSFGGMTPESQERVFALYSRVLAASSPISAARKQALWKDCLAFAADWGNNPMRYWDLDAQFQEQFGEFATPAATAAKAPAAAAAAAATTQPTAGTKHAATSQESGEAAGTKRGRTEEAAANAGQQQQQMTPEQQAAYYAWYRQYYPQGGASSGAAAQGGYPGYPSYPGYPPSQ